MNEQPDDWYKNREHKPDFEGAKNGLGDSAAGGAASNAAGAIKNKAKDGVQKLEERAVKEGLKAAVTAASAGAGAAAAPVIDKLDKIPIVKDAFGIVVKVFVPLLVLGGIGNMILGLLAILMPIIIMTAIVDKAADAIADSAVVRGGEIVIEGVTVVVDAVGDTASAIGNGADAVIPGDGVPCVRGPLGTSVGCGYNGSTNTVAANQESPVPAESGAVLAATSRSPDSRLSKLYDAMTQQGFFRMLYTKYGLRVAKVDGRPNSSAIILDGKIIKVVNTKAALNKEFEKNPKLRLILTRALKEDLHIVKYTDRVTVAEKGLSTYNTSQLFVPGAKEAAEPEDLASMRRASLETQNNPFLSAMTTDLACTKNCGTWVPDTVKEDSSELGDSISQETEYKTDGTLYSRMKKRLNEERENASFLEWYAYVREIHEAAQLEDPNQIEQNTFIQGALKTRKDQAARQYLHWRTTTDQYKTTNMTNESAVALFRNFSGGADSRAYRYLSGQSGGKGFKEYQKVNDTEPNIIKTIYNTWREDPDNKEQVVLVDAAINSDVLQRALNGGLFNFLYDAIANIVTGDTTKEAVVDAGFELGQQIMLPVCDASRAGANFVNCLYAGSEAVSRDIGISDYGHKGNITPAERERVAAYTDEMDAMIAAEKPLFQRLTSIEGHSSFARTFLLNAAIPLDINSAASSSLDYFLKLPAKIAQVAVTSANPSAMAADDGVSINKIKPAGNTLPALLDTPLSVTLDDPAGSLASCPLTSENEENLCRTDETTYLALAAKFDLLPGASGDTIFNVASYNILNAESWPGPSKDVGGCNTTPVANDPDCSKTRSTRQAQIIKGQGGAPVLDIIGMQEVSPKQYNQLKTLLPDYDAFPTDTRRMSNSKDGAVAIFWNKSKFTRFAKGKAPGISNTSYNITYPWVGLQAAGGQKVYVMSIHYPNSNYGGTPQVIKRASRLTMEWVKSKVSEDSLVIVVGDFNDQLGERLHYCIYTERSVMQHVHDMEQGDDLSQGCNRPDTGGIDHIYATPTLDVKASNWTHMPNTGVAAQSSDHTPVHSTLTIPGSTGSLKLATFNILHVGDSAFERQWRTRMPVSIDVLKRNAITVAGLQEVRPEQHDLLTTEAYAKDTYDIFPKTSKRPGFSPNPIIWNKALFSLVDGKTLDIEYDSGSRIDHAVLVKLQDGLGNKFYVLNTHDPADARPGSETQNALSRLNNARFYREKLATLAREGIPVFLTGDFNSSYTMSGNQKPYQNKAENLTYCVISSGGIMTNVWDTFQNKEFRCPRSSVPSGAGIDHIYTANINGVKRVWTAPDPQNGSDHPTVMADIKVSFGNDADSGIPPGAGGWAWPVQKRWWDNQRADFLNAHPTYSGTFTSPYARGVAVDISTPPDGSPVYSMLTGKVIKTNLCGKGEGMIIESTTPYGKLQIAYGHGTNPQYRVGQTVEAGKQILKVGAAGCQVTGGHLHIDMALDRKHICPQDVFIAMGRGENPNLRALVSRAASPCNRL